MSVSVWTERADLTPLADHALKLAVQCWFVAAVIAQWIFALYVIAFHGGTAIQGTGNAVLAVHLALGVIVFAVGPLQLIPSIRRHAPALHRASGRVYVVAIVLTSIAGLIMVWSRPEFVLLVQTGVSAHALLVIGCAAIAVRHAVARDAAKHRRWALRLFMVVNAGWFFRLGLTQWLLFGSGPADRPFLNVVSYVDYLLPLVLLELYLRTKDHGSASGRFALASLLFVITIAMAAGIFVVTKTLWLPRMTGAAQ